MAELLKRQYDLIVLKTELLHHSRDEPNVRFTLQAKVEGNVEDVATWMAHTTALGLHERSDLRERLGEGPPMHLPGDLIQGLSGFIAEKTTGDRPLWVHLVRPYGGLRFVPWERLLGHALGIPILMLPDFIFPPPREAQSTLEVVLCGSAPLGHEVWSVVEGVKQAADRILAAAVRRTRVHVFVDKDLTNVLQSHWSASGQLGSSILIHDHEIAAKYCTLDLPSRVLDRGDAIRSPWLLWMREALGGRSVDVLHFVCHGYISGDQGALLFAQSPMERSDRYLSGPVGAAELGTFLTQVGAWSTAFTSLADNYSEPGLRAIADEIAQSRPGPLLMHVLREDSGGSSLTDAYRFLYAIEPVAAPVSTALFIYCQPYRVDDATRARRDSAVLSLGMDFARNDRQRAAAEWANDASALDPHFEREEETSALVASTERFAEHVQLRYQQLARDEVLPAARSARDMQLAQETLGLLRKAVAEVAEGALAGGTAGKAMGSATMAGGVTATGTAASTVAGAGRSGALDATAAAGERSAEVGA